MVMPSANLFEALMLYIFFETCYWLGTSLALERVALFVLQSCIVSGSGNKMFVPLLASRSTDVTVVIE